MDEAVRTHKIRVIEVKEITTTDGKKFTAYKTIGKGGRKMDLRFSRDCATDTLPKEPCYIIVADDKANVDTTRIYPILWVKEVLAIEPIKRESNLAEYFDAE